MIYENNLIIGKANKYLLPFAKKIFVSYKDLEGIPEKYNNTKVEIGNLVREEILEKLLGLPTFTIIGNVDMLNYGDVYKELSNENNQ